MKIVTRLFIKYFVPLSAISLGVISMPSFAEMQISIEAYPGTKLIREHEQDFLVYPIATQAIDDDEFSPLNVEGRYSHRFYEGDETMSIDLAYRKLLATVSSEGFEVLFGCSNEECGGDVVDKPFGAKSFASRYSDVAYSGPVNNDFHYIVGKKSVDSQIFYLIYFIYKYSGNELRIAQDLVYLSEANEEALNVSIQFDQIESTGRVVLDGLFFSTDSATLEQESNEALESIANYLKSHVTKTFYIVGHTDSAGSIAHNKKLSEMRASSVKQSLIEKYQIEATRLSAYGVGPLSPLSTNRSDSGRAENRRVELVLKN